MLSFKNAVRFTFVLLLFSLFFSCSTKQKNVVLHGEKRIKYLSRIEKNYSLSGRAKMRHGFHGWWNLNIKDGKGLFFLKGPLGIGSRRFDIDNGFINYMNYSFDTSLIFLGLVKEKEKGLFLGADMMPDSLVYKDIKIKWMDYQLYKKVYLPSVIMVVYEDDTVMVYVEEIDAKI